MLYEHLYHTPPAFDDLIIQSDGEYLTRLSFVQEGPAQTCTPLPETPPVLEETALWLDEYFSGKSPNFTPRYRLLNPTPFRAEVSAVLSTIPFGETMTYGEIARILADRRGLPRMSAQAVGGAVGWNPICIIIPCHRVLGANGHLTGYSSGLENKIALLELEKTPFRGS